MTLRVPTRTKGRTHPTALMGVWPEFLPGNFDDAESDETRQGGYSSQRSVLAVLATPHWLNRILTNRRVLNNDVEYKLQFCDQWAGGEDKRGYKSGRPMLRLMLLRATANSDHDSITSSKVVCFG